MKEQEKLIFTSSLIEWYQKNKRDLPWRKDKNSYHVWISEIMLQQTRVEAVIPYYEKFLEYFPTIESLAKAEEDILFKLWEGLGYYSRVQNLKKCAKVLIENGQKKLPEEYEELKKLPGIGEYTAGAIASICYGKKTPAIDGNVLRVMSRILEDDRDILKQETKRFYFEYLKQLMNCDTSSFTQGLMEVGATVCIPNGVPLCMKCPFQTICKSRKNNTMLNYPYKEKKIKRKVEKRTVFIFQIENKIYIQQRPTTGLLAKLYEFPNILGYFNEEEVREKIPFPIKKIISVGKAKHIFSHMEWDMIGYFIILEKVRKKKRDLWVEKEELFTRYSIPNAFRFYKDFLEKEMNK